MLSLGLAAVFCCGIPATPARAAEGVAVALDQPHACFRSDSDGRGSTIARSYRSVIRRTFEREAAPGMDGAVTLRFESFKIGTARRWRTSDGYNFTADTSKPIRDLRVVFTTCTDYRTAIQLLRRERNFECFSAPTGETTCQVAGSSGGMMPDKTQYIQKN